jgi:hypothetical protein
MKIETHIKSSKKSCNIDGKDIHKWIDAHFEHDKFNEFIKTGILPNNWNPYSHRVHRHCIEALNDCLLEFKDKYTAAQIECVFKSHLKDDYRGKLPVISDFTNKKFHNKYHNL